MRLMLAAVVVELDPIGGEGSEFGYGLIAPQSKLFIFQTPPKPLDEDVVHPTASPSSRTPFPARRVPELPTFMKVKAHEA